MFHWFALLPAALAAAGVCQAAMGAFAAHRFARAPSPSGHCPPITVLKPLYGDEPLLEDALASFCAQDYPCFQLVCGVQRANDPAIAVVERLRTRFPDCDITLVVDPTLHGENRKIGNLINMLPQARHDVLVISDSDVHAAPDALAAIAEAIDQPGTGLVTMLYAGLPANRSLAARLGATAITHSFLPGALLSRTLGRQDCFGAVMALRRETLAAIGGLQALVHHLADDNILGRLVRDQGLAVRLAPTICATTVPEATLPALFRHELRWARTILALVPAGFAASAIQYPVFWAALAVPLSGAAWWSLLGVALAWAGRAGAARILDMRLGLAESGLATSAPIWLLPLRDMLSVAVMLASTASDRVEWRGEVLHTALDRLDGKTVSVVTTGDRPETA
ncbi:Glycosyltransferase [Rhodovastum atsumiense]|uniref:Glycosyltransferase n=1 Tax=Rhodovastum atsumiense TaxID=504468 RepID=A0A5M6IRW9_9PROT|nr:bacteriohopanetetrol glucosamine biosynthesis glycosyltransferase HpnI [Rhodovastum atsumiense]KAA5610318.1 glycosyltransferase [Rhodovastum atsumiense]CAH2600944.1 Glycosyltransferase [Rhodovastum atsumiense]